MPRPIQINNYTKIYKPNLPHTPQTHTCAYFLPSLCLSTTNLIYAQINTKVLKDFQLEGNLAGTHKKQEKTLPKLSLGLRFGSLHNKQDESIVETKFSSTN